jgi:uncharacterized protein (DUF924 family)
MSNPAVYEIENKPLFNPALDKEILDFWLEGCPVGPIAPYQDKNLDRWFASNRTPEECASFDQLCITKFSSAIKPLKPSFYPLPISTPSYNDEVSHAAAIASPLYLYFSSNPSTALSLVILLDQLPRNMFRDEQTLPYYHFDLICRSLLRTMLANNYRPDLDPSIRFSISKRMWFYLPFMHSEHLEDHEMFEELFESLGKDTEEGSDERTKVFMASFLAYEKLHSDMLKRFGRYSYRNEHIGRESTKEEREVLVAGGFWSH